MNSVGYFDFDGENPGCYTFGRLVEGKLLVRAIEQAATGLVLGGQESHKVGLLDGRWRFSVTLESVSFRVTAPDRSAFDPSQQYDGIKVCMPPDVTDEIKRLLCVFCTEVDIITQELTMIERHRASSMAH